MMKNILRTTGKTLGWVLLPFLLYATVAVLLGLVPVNKDFKEPQDGLDIYIRTTPVHTDILVPTKSAPRDWRSIFKVPGIDKADYISVGWGDRKFYLETRTWGDLRPLNALSALFGMDSSVMHVAAETKPEEDAHTIRVRITGEQFSALADQIEDSLAHDKEGAAQPIPGAHYADNDLFYEAQGRYSMFLTCNQWVRNVLANSGIRTALWAPVATAVQYQTGRIKAQ